MSEKKEDMVTLAKQGDASNQSMLGTFLISIHNYKEGVYWLKKAAEQGEAVAQYNLGVCYNKGLGVKQDTNKALFWFKKAEENKYYEGSYLKTNKNSNNNSYNNSNGCLIPIIIFVSVLSSIFFIV